LIYDSINKMLLKNNILAPKLISENYSKNYIEIEDFGDQTIFNLLKKSSINKLVIFKQIIRLLNKLQLIRQRKIKNFKNDFEIISVLRNLKIIGIFTRLAIRDNKKKYLKLIPYAWKLIKLRSENNDKFKDLNDLLDVFYKRYI